MHLLSGRDGLRVAALAVVPFALAFLSVASGACGGVQQTVLSADPDSGDKDAASVVTCTTNDDCNRGSRLVVAQDATCENGTCTCATPGIFSRNGCIVKPKSLTVCEGSGGTCEGALGAPGDTPCKTSGGIVLQGPGGDGVGCNDAQHETCCIPSCNGWKIENATFLCVRTTGGCAPPVCVQNELDCPAGTQKTEKGGGCSGG